MSRKTKIEIKSEYYEYQPEQSDKYINNIRELVALMFYEQYKKTK